MSLTALLYAGKKNPDQARNHDSSETKKMLLAMKLTFILITAAFLQVSATGTAQTITYKAKNEKLEKVFSEIKKQTGFLFFYSTEDIETAKPVTVELKNESIDEALKKILIDQPLQYVIKGNTIFIKKKSVTVDLQSTDNSLISQLPPPIDITGKVTDENGNPLVGASVKVKGSSKGTTTNNDGVFTLKGVSDDAVLEISYVGYSALIVDVNRRSNIVASLKVNPSPLDEMQVIAYGQTTKRLSTGNVSSVKAKDIEKQPVTNPLLAIQGRVPGVIINQATGFAGSGVAVQIQGQNTLRFDVGNDPLYIIDGVPYPSRLLFSFGQIQGSSGGNAPNVGGLEPGYGSPMSYINPADIESIDILKDADATAIYGSRAANGAIVITTKKGKPGQTKVDINMQTGWGEMTRRLDLLNTPQYLEMRREAFKNDNSSPSLTGFPGDYDLLFWDTTRFTDWQKVLLGGTAHYTDMQASVSGGSSNTQFLMGAGYHKETTVFPGDFADQKGSVHFNINNVSSNQKFRLQLTGSYIVDDNKLFQRDLTQDAIRIAPVAPALYNSDGSLNWAPLPNGNSTWTNPLSYLNQHFNNKTNNVVGNVVVSYRIFPGLEMKSSLGYTNMQSNQLLTTPLSSVRPEYKPFSQRTSNFFNNNINSWIIEPQAVYRKTIGKGRLEFLGGLTIHQNNSKWINMNGNGYSSDLVMESLSAAPRKDATDGSAQYKYNAIFGRLNYNLKEKYIININARRDGSSRFGAKNQFHNFGSVAGAWIFSEEKFIQKTFPFVSFGKLRASYGTTGNDQIGDYRFLNQYRIFSGGVAYQGVSGSAPTGLPNPYLAWEETRKLQFGLDLGFFNDRILLAGNYYRDRSSNQLLDYTLPIMTGFNGITRNFPALVQNTGLELTLNTTNISNRNFKWTSSLNLTIPKNKLLKFPDLDKSPYANSLVIGQPITVANAKTYHFLGADPTTGIYQFADKNGKPVSTPAYPDDYTSLVNLAPKFYGGFQNNFQYKGFELDVLFQFVKQIGSNYKFGNLPGLFYDLIGNQPTSVLNRWQKPGDNKTIQKYFSSFFNSSMYVSNIYAWGSDAAYSDASYIRLKNLSLSWQLPEKWKHQAHLQSARIYVQGQNLLTITNYQGLDPETKSSTTLPPLRVITLGVQVTL